MRTKIRPGFTSAFLVAVVAIFPTVSRAQVPVFVIDNPDSTMKFNVSA